MAKIQNRESKRLHFAELRANGETIKSASASIGISERLGRQWDRELDSMISVSKHENEAGIYDKYGIKRGQRIERLAKTTQSILEASEHIDFEALAKEKPDKLLDLYLRFIEAAANNEQSESIASLQTSQDALNAIESLYNRVSSGKTSRAQAEIELKVIGVALQGIEAAKTETKLSELEIVLKKLESSAI